MTPAASKHSTSTNRHLAGGGHDVRRLSGQRAARTRRRSGRAESRRQPDAARGVDRLRPAADQSGRAGRRDQPDRLLVDVPAPGGRPRTRTTKRASSSTRANTGRCCASRSSASALGLLLMARHAADGRQTPAHEPSAWTFAVVRGRRLFVMIWAGRHFYTRAWAALRHRTADMNTLIAVGTGAAFIYSVVATFAPSLLSRRRRAADVYYEAVILIIALVLLGNAMEARAKRQTTRALREMARLQPSTARVRRDGVERGRADRAGRRRRHRPRAAGRALPRRRRRASRQRAPSTNRC